jgi:hypothetical protein
MNWVDKLNKIPLVNPTEGTMMVVTKGEFFNNEPRQQEVVPFFINVNDLTWLAQLLDRCKSLKAYLSTMIAFEVREAFDVLHGLIFRAFPVIRDNIGGSPRYATSVESGVEFTEESSRVIGYVPNVSKV